MPYWGSSSRVGVQPTTTASSSSSKQKKRSERFGRKGITMEDLKKQTALRLAQEQNRQNPKSSSYGSRSSVTTTSSSHHHHSHHQERTQPPPAPTPPPPPPVPQYAPPPPPATPYRDVHSSYATSRQAPPPMRGGPEFLSPPPPPSNYGATNSNNPSPAAFSSDQAASKQQKGKLPHGLTVQELKEMTKARLQAEAASKQPAPVIPEPAVRREPDSASTRLVSASPEPALTHSPVPPGFAPRAEPAYLSQERESWEASQYMAPSYTSAEPFGRSSSFPKTPGAVTDNRRRAATLSPRFHQSYALHEDREVESFAMTASTDSAARERTFSSSSSYEVREQPLDPRERTYSGSTDPLFGGGNRARASSAASLPPMSQTADEFGIDKQQAPTPLFGTVREESPALQLADVFRVSSFDKQEEEWSAAGAAVEVENRMRASTWSEPSLLGGGTSVEDSLASILNLNGSSSNHNRSNF